MDYIGTYVQVDMYIRIWYRNVSLAGSNNSTQPKTDPEMRTIEFNLLNVGCCLFLFFVDMMMFLIRILIGSPVWFTRTYR